MVADIRPKKAIYISLTEIQIDIWLMRHPDFLYLSIVDQSDFFFVYLKYLAGPSVDIQQGEYNLFQQE